MLILDVSPILEPDRDSVHGHPRDIEELAISDFGCRARRIAGTSTRFASISLMQCTYETVGCRKLIYNIYFNLVWENNFPSHEESIFFLAGLTSVTELLQDPVLHTSLLLFRNFR